MAVAWPAGVPAPAGESGLDHVSGLADDQVRQNPENTRRLPDAELPVSWLLDATQMAAFLTLYDTTLTGGADWFSATWLASLDATASYARFAEPYQRRPKGLYWEVSARLEVIR